MSRSSFQQLTSVRFVLSFFEDATSNFEIELSRWRHKNLILDEIQERKRIEVGRWSYFYSQD